jgi:TonB-dependent SusC/RagA subfamily outer membrane receptor
MAGRFLRTLGVTALGLLRASSLLAQGAVLRGTVTSADRKEPIAGAEVLIAALNLSVLTSERGTFVIAIPPARFPGTPVTLTARAIGFKSVSRVRTLEPGDITTDFALVRDINRLEEVIVTGTLEAVERAKVPYAVGRLTSEDLPVVGLDPLRSLMGKIPGVRIAQSNGKPGTAPEVLLRGPTSMNGVGRGQGPLIIVDGAIMNDRVPSGEFNKGILGDLGLRALGMGLEELGAFDIESIEVVKGAAGTTLYGTRAANGVITIRTKRGLTGREGVRFTARTEIGFSDLSSVNYRQPVNHHLQLDETGKRFCVAPVAGSAPCARTVDWMTEILRINNVASDDTVRAASVVLNSSVSTALLRNTFQSQNWPGRYYNQLAQASLRHPTILSALDATGRAGQVGFYVSTSYQDDPGSIIGYHGIQARRGRVNLDYSARSDLKLSISTLYDNTTRDLRNLSFRSFMRGGPSGTDYLARDTLGRRIIRTGGQDLHGLNGGFNPLYDSDNWHADRTTGRFLGTFTGRYLPAQWATFEATFSYDNRARTDKDYVPIGYRNNFNTIQSFSSGQMYAVNVTDEAYSTSLTATFRTKLRRELDATLSFRAIHDQESSRSSSSYGETFRVPGIFQLSNLSSNLDIRSASQTIRNTGVFVGAKLDYRDRYVLEGLLRYDGSSLFGAGHRWAPFGRISGVWLVSREPFFRVGFLDDLRLRASRGTAGSTPSFSAQYETYSFSTNGAALVQAGNSQLRPETTTEYEVGTDFTLFHRLGVEATYAYGRTRDQILPVNTIASLGFATQWQNAGTLVNRTWELGLNLTVANRRGFSWGMHGTWARTRTTIAELVPPPYVAESDRTFLWTADPRRVCLPGEEGHYFGEPGYGDGEARPHCTGRPLNRFGNIWGRRFFTKCSELPEAIRGPDSCGGDRTPYQVNDDGWVVWVGAGNSWKEGITRNLWQVVLPANENPWCYGLSFGHPIIDRPLCGQPGQGTGILQVVGNTLPDFRFGFSNDIQLGRVTLYALLDATIGHHIKNGQKGLAGLDFQSSNSDQARRSVETAKPLGYSWRAGPPEGIGTGGLYDAAPFGSSNYAVEKGSFAKLRELSLTYRVGPILRVGDWTAGVVGRNVLTITGYSGTDPEVGDPTGSTGSGLIYQTGGFDFPTLRTYTISLATRF